MTLQAVIVLILLAALVVPVIAAEVARRGRRPVSKPARPIVEAAPKPPLRLVVNKNDMDRELAALLAEDSRKPTERDDK